MPGGAGGGGVDGFQDPQASQPRKTSRSPVAGTTTEKRPRRRTGGAGFMGDGTILAPRAGSRRQENPYLGRKVARFLAHQACQSRPAVKLSPVISWRAFTTAG